MTLRRVLLLGLVAVVAALVVALWIVARPSPISRENAAKIQIGMTLAEVEAILGGPARDETTGPVVADVPPDPTTKFTFLAHYWSGDVAPPEWHADDVTIIVNLDGAGRVAKVEHWPMRRSEVNLLARIRRWLGV